MTADSITATVGLSWSGVTAGKRTVGGAQWLDASGKVQATTVLRVSNDGSLPVQNVPTNVPSKLVDAAINDYINSVKARVPKP